MKYGQEDIEHIKFADWLRYKKVPFFHIANQRKCTPQFGRQLKRMGVVKGVFDIFIGVPVSPYSGLFIEMKTSLGSPSKEQEEFKEIWSKQGYKCVVAYGFEQAKEEASKYFGFDSVTESND